MDTASSTSRIVTLPRVLCTGDVFCAPGRGATPVLESYCRVLHPEIPWRFWHLGEARCTARQLFDERARRILGHDADRILLSVGQAELASEDAFDPATIAGLLADLVSQLADKSRARLSLLLPSPSFQPEARRALCRELRQAVRESCAAVAHIDAEPQALAFLEGQRKHPDEAFGLVDPGPVPTLAGSLLLAQRIHEAWFGA